MAHPNALETCCNLLDFIEKIGGRTHLRDNTKYHMAHEALKVTSWSALAGVMPETAKALKLEIEDLCDRYRPEPYAASATSAGDMAGQPGRLPSAGRAADEPSSRRNDGGADLPRQKGSEPDQEHAAQATTANVTSPKSVRTQPEMPRSVEQAPGGLQRARIQTPGTKHGAERVGRKSPK